MRKQLFAKGGFVAIFVALAVCVAPAVASASAKSEKKQNAAIKKNAKNIKKAAGALTTLAKSVKGIDDRLKTIEGAAPTLIENLTKVGAGLTALKDATTAGFDKVSTSLKSTEYGIGQLIVLEPAPNPQEGSFVETPDIPDAVQQAQTTQQFVAQNTGNLAVSYGVRSGESDGTGAALPAAFCKVTVTNEGGTTETTAPNAGLGGVPFQPVNDKSTLTSTIPANAGFPFGLKTTAPDDDKVTTFVSAVAVTAGDTYTVGLACVDTSADANDPSA
jgi:hypothetical protein